jgi:hypothetical protein
MKKLLFVFLLLPSLNLAQTMYKCPSVGGVAFQQIPCEGGQEIQIKKLDSGLGADSSGLMEYMEKKKKEEERLKEEQRIAKEDKDKNKAIEEMIKSKGIVEGKTYWERWSYCGRLPGYLRNSCYEGLGPRPRN